MKPSGCGRVFGAATFWGEFRAAILTYYAQSSPKDRPACTRGVFSYIDRPRRNLYNLARVSWRPKIKT